MTDSRSETTAVRFFEQLYAIVVGLGLALAIEQVLDLGRAGIPVVPEHIPLFLAYINLAFPLAHSSVRYLELAYVDREAGTLSKSRVLADLVLGTGQFLWVIALSFLISRPTSFAVVTIVLLVGRPLRDVLVVLARQRTLTFDRKVAVVHGATVACLAIVVMLAQFYSAADAIWIVRVGTLAASLVFALGLYLTAFPYFFWDEDR